MTAKVWTAARAALTLGAGIFVIGLVSGLLYEQAQRARDRERFPQVGRSVDIGGRMLNLYCSGAGQPAVILESGAKWPLSSAVREPKTIFSNGGPRPGYSWVSIQRALATVTTVCWYDRAGNKRYSRIACQNYTLARVWSPSSNSCSTSMPDVITAISSTNYIILRAPTTSLGVTSTSRR